MAVPIPAFCGTRAIGIQDKEDLKSKRLYCVLAQVEKTCANWGKPKGFDRCMFLLLQCGYTASHQGMVPATLDMTGLGGRSTRTLCL